MAPTIAGGNRRLVPNNRVSCSEYRRHCIAALKCDLSGSGYYGGKKPDYDRGRDGGGGGGGGGPMRGGSRGRGRGRARPY